MTIPTSAVRPLIPPDHQPTQPAACRSPRQIVSVTALGGQTDKNSATLQLEGN